MLVTMVSTVTVGSTLMAMAVITVVAMVVMMALVRAVIVSVRAMAVLMMTVMVERAKGNQCRQWHDDVSTMAVMGLCWRCD